MLAAMLSGASTAVAASPVGYQFDGLAFYQYGDPTDLAPGLLVPFASPDTGFVRITNHGASTFTGTVGFNAVTGHPGPLDFSNSFAVVLGPGDHHSYSFNGDSSDQGGWNAPQGTVQPGAQFFMKGTVSNGSNSEIVNLTILDQDIHSRAFRTNPQGVLLDNYILQGGDPLGRDTGDVYETTQSPGPFQFFEAGPPAEQPITATGTTFTAAEGSAFSGTVASFSDPNAGATASEYSATIDWGDGSPAQSGVITGAAGSFAVSGPHTYADEGAFTPSVTIADADDATNSASATSAATVNDGALTAICAAPALSPTSFNGNLVSLADSNPGATAADFKATIDWGDSSTSAATVSQAGAKFMLGGSHAYSSSGFSSLSVSVADDGGALASAGGCQTLLYGFAPGGGAFAIGDGNSATGAAVTFWGAQWPKANSLSGGPAPAAFKGFALIPATPACGGAWSTDPGNSAPPSPGPLPAYMAVIVTSSTSQSGSQISGDSMHMVVVKTDAGYAPDAGSPGTGTVVAHIC
jgi:hypothetical protein